MRPVRSTIPVSYTHLDVYKRQYLTLYHWELPLALHQQGGWMNPQSPKWFGEYAGVIAAHFSDRVRYYFTFNEPQVFVGHGCANGIHAPGLKMSPWDTFAMAHNVLKAHGMAVRALRDKARGEVKIGYAPTASLHYPCLFYTSRCVSETDA